MTNVIQFIPRGAKSSQENLEEFIRFCKEDLTIFGADLDFESNKWDISKVMKFRGNLEKKAVICFGEFLGKNTRCGDFVPFSKNILNFSKAYMRYMHAMRPTMSYPTRLIAFKALNYVFDDKPLAYLSLTNLNDAANWIEKNYSEGVAYRAGGQLQSVFEFMCNKGMLANPFSWSNFIKRPSDTQRIGKEADERRVQKLPSQAVLNAITQIFRMSKSPRDTVISSVMAILCASPDRIAEVMELPYECEVFQKGNDGTMKYGLRWWPAKGADPQVKWIIPSMAEVVQEAIKKIKEVAAPARELALWYEEHPNNIFLPNELEHLRGKDVIEQAEVLQILGLGQKKGAFGSWIRYQNIETVTISHRTCIRFDDFESHILSRLPVGFPYLDKSRNLKYSDCLFLARRNELNSQKSSYLCFFEHVATNVIQGSVGGKSRVSIFDNYGFTEPDGSRIKVTTHQFRHYLNTLAQAGGMSQLDIAKWSGRKDVRQNAAYDHVSGAERVQMIRSAIGDPSKSLGPLTHLSGRALIPRDEFARLIVPTAHVTDIGYCVHDFTMSPCETYRDCINCQEMVCIKGDKTAERNIKIALDESHKLLSEAQNAVSEGYYGANRWQEQHEMRYERLSQLNEILDDNMIPDGTVIQLSKPQKTIESNTKKITNKDKK